MRILVLNGGSSSFKCALYDLAGEAFPITLAAPEWKETIEWAGEDLGVMLDKVIRKADAVDIVGHRIVHGGEDHRASTRITDQVRSAIAAQVELAPAHNRFELEAIDAVARTFGSTVAQAAVFDTAFHSTMEPSAYVYPGPYEWLTSEGIRRYGFHGISFQYSRERAAEMLGGLPSRILVCHLGSGASLCAIRDGKSVDTTMGFTPLEGLMMGARSGSLDPGILIYLLRHRGYAADDLDRILNRESGLLGVSGVSSDMRAIQKAIAVGNARAQLAFDIYIHRLTREAGAMIGVLGGLDALVFTGGVGVNFPVVREELCSHFAFLGLLIDPQRNASAKSDVNVAATNSSVSILVIQAQEEWEIARECWSLARHGTTDG
jgi:acetate kinase